MAQAMRTSTFIAPTKALSRTNTTRAASRVSSVRVVAREAAWAPGSDAPSHLDGSMAGDFGFDPLGLVRALISDD